MGAMTTIHHVMTPEDWAAFQASGTSRVSTRGRSLDDEGFVHCSFDDQVERVIAGFYADLPEIAVVSLDRDRIAPPVVVEAATDGSGEYPHVYGPLNLDAVVEVVLRPPG